MNEKGEFKEIKEYEIKPDKGLILNPSIVASPPAASDFLMRKMHPDIKLKYNPRLPSMRLYQSNPKDMARMSLKPHEF